MDSVKLYNELLEEKATLDLIPDVLALQDRFLQEKNYKYYFLCNNKIIEIYINAMKLEAALDAALEMSKKTNVKNYVDSYKELLDQLVYIYITKQYYLRALDICLTKKEYLDTTNFDEVNRWYLELSYIHEAIGEKNEALRKLTSILSNNPDPEIKAVALNNIIKLFIDDNNTEEAKEYLNECILLVHEINDEEGIRYCDYLKARILRLEQKYKEAKKIFVNLFKNNPELESEDHESENFNYLNEYINLLIDSDLIKEGFELCEKYYDSANLSYDLENKLVFYKSCLKLEVILIEQGKKRKKKSIFDPTIILTKINELEKEISRNKDKKSLEANEEELSFQAKNLENQAYKKAINTLNDVIIDYSNGNIRTTLMNFCSSLKAKMPFDEMILVILNKEKDNIIPDIKINAEDDNIYTYDYKNDRLYERVVSFNNLMGTPVEKLLSNKNELIINLQSEENMVKSPINGSDLRKEYKYLFASSLKKGNKTYGNIFFLSKTFDILGNYPKFILSLVTKELSFAMVSLFNINNNNLQYNILKTCNKNTNSGIIYYDVNNESYYFSDEVVRIISDITPTSPLNNEIRYTDYMKYIVKSDYDKLIIRNEKISLKQPYEIEYHLKEIDDNKNVILVHEQASPYITLSDEVYYCGKITKVVLSEQIIDDFKTKNILDEKEFDSFIYNNSHKNMIINAFKFNNELNDNEVFNLIRNNYTKYNNSDSNFNSKIYFIKGIYYYVLFDLSDKEAYKLIKEMAKYCSCSYFVYPNMIKRLDEIKKIAMFVLKEKNGFESFTNDLYASYISLDALNECFNKSLINKDISLDLRKVTVGNYFFGYYLTPCLKGIYDYDSLINIDDEAIYKLDKMVINYLKNENDIINKESIILMRIRNSSLLKALNENVINDNHQIIFELDNEKDIDEILDKISSTNCKVIIGLRALRCLSFKSLSDYSRLIVGFKERIDDNLLEIFKMFQKNYYFYDKKGFVVDSQSIIKSLK